MIGKLMKKEFQEFLRTGKFYALTFVFLFFSILSPVAAKFLPELIKSLSQEITIVIPPPTWKDAFSQFFKNLNQIVFLAIVLMFLGSVAEEKNKGTASLIVSKGVDRRKWIIAKFLFQFILVALLLIISFFICFYYSLLLFPDTIINLPFSGTILFLIYMFFILSLIIFSSSVGNNLLQAGGIFFTGFILLNILTTLPNLRQYNPMVLSSIENQWLLTGINWNGAVKSIISTVLISLVVLLIGALHFYKQELQ
jgi:ABC-2 type transport system permease protein